MIPFLPPLLARPTRAQARTNNDVLAGRLIVYT